MAEEDIDEGLEDNTPADAADIIEDYFPAVANFPNNPTEYTEPTDVHHGAVLEDVRKVDLALANGTLRMVRAGWDNVKSIRALCRMVDVTFKAIECRRKVLGLPYGTPGNSSRSDVVIPDYD